MLYSNKVHQLKYGHSKITIALVNMEVQLTRASFCTQITYVGNLAEHLFCRYCNAAWVSSYVQPKDLTH
ncbi:hypothetical protein T12_9395 [Trichinella patagoniensis]|uniref:Uncharacterized protein n=1 Tax=Trichinella patagoniensis TaxID=990121 RepID=A0A0V0ZSV4_9BILA|nr:hypothetical protein T12_9395 [Trichinella patagoniensis]